MIKLKYLPLLFLVSLLVGIGPATMGQRNRLRDAGASAPVLSSATISPDGETLTLVFDVAVTQGAGYNDGDLNIDSTIAGNDIGVTYVSGNGTTTHVYTLAKPTIYGDTVDLDFNGDANSLENGSGGDLAAIASGAVTEQSSLIFYWPVTADNTTITSSGGYAAAGVDVSGGLVGSADLVEVSAEAAIDTESGWTGWALKIPNGANYITFDNPFDLTAAGAVVRIEAEVFLADWVDNTRLINLVRAANDDNAFYYLINGDETRISYYGQTNNVTCTTDAASLAAGQTYPFKMQFRLGATDPSLNNVIGADNQITNTDLTAWAFSGGSMRFGNGNATGSVFYLKNIRAYSTWE